MRRICEVRIIDEEAWLWMQKCLKCRSTGMTSPATKLTQNYAVSISLGKKSFIARNFVHIIYVNAIFDIFFGLVGENAEIYD